MQARSQSGTTLGLCPAATIAQLTALPLQSLRLNLHHLMLDGAELSEVSSGDRQGWDFGSRPWGVADRTTTAARTTIAARRRRAIFARGENVYIVTVRPHRGEGIDDGRKFR